MWFELLWRGALVFVSVVVGLYAAGRLLWRVERLAGPISRRTGVPASLVALAVVEAKAPHAVLAEAYRRGVLEFRHLLQFTFATWPLRVVLLHLRIGVIPVALGALGWLGAAYLGLVYLSSAVGFLIAWRTKVRWPDMSAELRRLSGVRVWRQAASVTLRYLAFEAVFMALDLLGIRISFGWLPLSPEALAVASIAAFRPTYGIMAGAPAFHSGRIGAVELLLALMLGRVVYMSVYEFPRSAVQFYASIYPPGVAGRLTAYTAAVMYSTAVPVLAALFLLIRGT
ncbi:hypothetical protein ODS41_02415 [Pyrobaculum sp. 3827-6]|uniref:hypothetical protein n=1 Tax=Pyrobaculum sp. 3827-6 TaxID=2983604 RepID=UPI0021DAEBCC|nr:hypothetical protein [Pyrobaculum sp. 3827-6]MCU7786784.1 hypothetical protein [Pyrobaculum sp. 3827-6]